MLQKKYSSCPLESQVDPDPRAVIFVTILSAQEFDKFGFSQQSFAAIDYSNARVKARVMSREFDYKG